MEPKDGGAAGDPFVPLRHELVERQLRQRGIRDERVLDAMREVPRELFVPDPLRSAAYKDRALPIGYGQTISQPYTVAFMCQALQLGGAERVLEVGTGSGYAAAVLSRLASNVYSVEFVAELAAGAQRILQNLGYANVRVLLGDGSVGLPDFAPYDAIIVAAAGDSLPAPYAGQLREGGRIVIPLRSGTEQRMYRFTRCGDCLKREPLGEFAFVPLVGKYGAAAPADTDPDG